MCVCVCVCVYRHLCLAAIAGRTCRQPQPENHEAGAPCPVEAAFLAPLLLSPPLPVRVCVGRKSQDIYLHEHAHTNVHTSTLGLFLHQARLLSTQRRQLRFRQREFFLLLREIGLSLPESLRQGLDLYV